MVEPAAEYCFLWINWWPTCMTKAEWSGWMQAIGSILALLIAIGIPWYSQRATNKQAASIARGFCGQALQSLGALKEACRGPDAAQARAQRKILEDALAVGSSVPLHQVTSSVMVAVLTARAIVIDTLDRTKELGTGHLTWEQGAAAFEGAEQSVSTVAGRAKW